MSLKPTKAESGVFKGCLLAAIIGMILGGIGSYIFLQTAKVEVDGPQGLFVGMVVIIGVIAGGFIGSLIGAILNAIFSKKEIEEEEF
jgi:hypothetical protein